MDTWTLASPSPEGEAKESFKVCRLKKSFKVCRLNLDVDGSEIIYYIVLKKVKLEKMEHRCWKNNFLRDTSYHSMQTVSLIETWKMQQKIFC